MAMRITGLNSGLDTESIIQELVAVRQTKVDEQVKAQTKMEWKQDAWKELNTKLKNLQTKYINNMRFSTAYAKKTTSVSNSSIANVITGENAVNGVQELKVEKMAKTAYLTGAEISRADGQKINALAKLSDINEDFAGGEFTFTRNGKSETITVAEDATISDVLNELKNRGLNASFDAKNQRFFVSAKESGKESDFELTDSGNVLSTLGLTTESGAVKIDGENAEISLNGAKFSSKTNVFEINGLTITALAETKEGESVTLTTQNDTDGIYDLVKDFLKEYNSVINEMDKLYNADAAKGYEPLTEDEKYSMSEREIEEWEEKVKSSLLRRDSNLSTISSALKEIMSGSIEINGKSMSLSSFGINTLGYFTAADNEKNAYHIDGDPDNSNTSGNADKLKGMIASDPDTVVSFFTQLSQKLYTKMSSLSASVEGYRSFGNFYDDKKMKEDYNDYTSKIADLEEKLGDYEDGLYAQYAAMETALAKMQSNANAVTSLLGGA